MTTWVADELISAVVTSDVVKLFVDDSKFVFVVVVAAIVEFFAVVLPTVDVSVELHSEMMINGSQ